MNEKLDDTPFPSEKVDTRNFAEDVDKILNLYKDAVLLRIVQELEKSYDKGYKDGAGDWQGWNQDD